MAPPLQFRELFDTLRMQDGTHSLRAAQTIMTNSSIEKSAASHLCADQSNFDVSCVTVLAKRSLNKGNAIKREESRKPRATPHASQSSVR
jgi:hypothetical protein